MFHAVEEFLAALFEPGELVETRRKHKSQEGGGVLRSWDAPDVVAARASEWDDGDHHVWFGPAPRTRRGGTRADCATPRCLFIDIDPEGQGSIAEAYWPIIYRALERKPSIVVHSGRGFQLYWLTTGDCPDWQSISRGWTEAVRSQLSDLPVVVDSTFDLPRMMRLPYTTNPKVGKVARIVEMIPSLVYDASSFPSSSGASEVPVVVDGAVPEGGRNPHLWRLGTRLKWAGLRGEALASAVHALNEAVNSPPLPAREVDSMVSRMNDPRTPQPLTSDQSAALLTSSDVAELAGEQLAGEIMSVRQGGRAVWYVWSEETGVWMEGPPNGALYSWLSRVRSQVEGDGAQIITRCLDVGAISRIASHIASSPGLPSYVDATAIDSQPEVLPLRNTYLNLNTMERIAPDPALRFTRRAEVDLDPDATCPTWMRFLDQMMPDPEEREFLGKCFFYCLLGHNRARAFFINLGVGRNGKTIAWGALSSILGGFAAPGDHRVVTKSSDSSHDAPVAGLMGLRLSIYDELSDGDELNGAQVKRLTGGDRVRARGAYAPKHDDITVTSKQVLISNHRPRVRGEDQAVGDRLRYIQWRVRLEDHEVDQNMKERLLAERSGIFNWILSHADAYYADPNLTMPERLAAEAREYMEDENEMLAFVRRHISIPAEPNLGLFADGQAIGNAWRDFTGEKLVGRRWATFYKDLVRQIELEGGKVEVVGSRTKRLKGVVLVLEGEELL